MSRDVLQNLPDEVKNFSAEHSGENIIATRERVAELEKRQEEREKSASEKIRELKEKIESLSIDLGQALDQKEELETNLTAFEMKLMGKIVNILKIREVKNKINLQTEKLSVLQQEFDEVSTTLSQVEQLMNDKTELAVIEETLKIFAQTETDKYHEHQEMLRVCDVGRISQEHDVFFLHSFFDEGVAAQAASVLDVSHFSSLKTRIDVNIGLNPSLSTSTLRLGTHQDRRFAQNYYGGSFILKGGVVTDANNFDSGSTASGLERVSSSGLKKKTAAETKAKIDASITQKEEDSWNEILVKEPKFAGYLIPSLGVVKPSGGIIPSNARHESRAAVYRHLYELGCPFYFEETTKQNEKRIIKKVRYNPEDNSFEVGQEVGVEEILNSDFEITDDQRKKAREAIFEDCPFNLDGDAEKTLTTTYWKSGLYDYNMLTTEQDEETSGGSDRNRKTFMMHKKSGRINLINAEGIHSGGENCGDVRSYLAYFEGETVRLKTKMEAGSQNLASTISTLERHAWFLCGFAEGAKRAGDQETYSKAMTLIKDIDQLTKEDEIKRKEIIHRRFGENPGVDSKFKIDEADLKHITTVAY